uniref:RRH-like protein n=1 Tax=Hofstenia miamia TaxID=442651 RepID=A0A5P8I4N0_HOFMI|nr:RRH-like protein [Hofstenia miamia]
MAFNANGVFCGCLVVSITLIINMSGLTNVDLITGSASKFIAGYYFVSGVLGVVSHFILIVLFLFKKELRTVSNALIAQLCLIDLICIAKHNFIATAAYYHAEPVTGVLCLIYGWTSQNLGFLEMGTVAAIALDRYLSYVKGIPATIGNRWFLFIYPLITGLSLPFLPLSGIGEYAQIQHGYTCDVNWVQGTLGFKYYILLGLMLNVFPNFFISLICYVLIDEKFRTTQAEKQNGEMQYTLLLPFAMALQYSVYSLCAMMGVFGATDIPAFIVIGGILVIKTGMLMNAFFYGYTSKDFRNALCSN